ncbi:MAG: 2-oxoacid:acceptor oxidoreductase family protein [Planctomycetes bacterium]|nr:2-oxoacid:acceptor oxidoreductase family protein [Planctomycetota bacterium]
MYKEIRFTGFGGQGIILVGHIVGDAATIHENKQATLTQSYGPESRGGACSAQLIISDKPINYPHLTSPDILFAMSPEGYHKYKNEVKPGGIILVEENIPVNNPPRGIKLVHIPATRLAEGLGKKIVANMIMLGALAAITKIVGQAALRKAIAASVPRGTDEFNLKAFETGIDYALKPQMHTDKHG